MFVQSVRTDILRYSPSEHKDTLKSHLKDLSVSDWLKPLADSPASGAQIWKTFAISSKMASIVQAIARNRLCNREVLGTRLYQLS